MNANLLGPAAPGFDQPLELLEACHGRIGKQCATLERLLAGLSHKGTPIRYGLKPVRNRMSQHGCDAQAMQAARAILNYFDSAAVHHHDDEERNLFPLIQKAGKGEALDLCDLVERLTSEHDDLALLWRGLRPALQALAEGQTAALDQAKAQRFIELNRSHLAFENERLLPLARRLLQAADLERLGRAMAARRDVPYTR